MNEEEPKLTAEQRLQNMWWRHYHLGTAMTSLTEALTARSDEDPRHLAYKVQKVNKHLIEYLAHLNNKVDFTKEEASRSSSFHTCLRKYDDTKAGTIMYRMWSERRGELAWMAIIKNWRKGLDDILDALDMMEGSCDDVIMKLAFEAWVEDDNFKPIFDLIKKWEDAEKADEDKKKLNEKGRIQNCNTFFEPS